MATVVVVHAHPDDEAIFTGGTIRLLHGRGDRVVLVLATGGEEGGDVVLRRAEVARAAELLGVDRVVELGLRDSGMAGDPANHAPGSLWSTPLDDVVARLVEVCVQERPDALVGYDDHGVYGHPDHLRVAEATRRAAEVAGVRAHYAATVDREYLHFVETHLVEEASLGGDLGLAGTHVGLPTVEITTVVDVHPVLDVKRAAMAAHASQIPETGSALQLGPAAFRDVYGFEWYVRSGPPGVLDDLT